MSDGIIRWKDPTGLVIALDGSVMTIIGNPGHAGRGGDEPDDLRHRRRFCLHGGTADLRILQSLDHLIHQIGRCRRSARLHRVPQAGDQNLDQPADDQLQLLRVISDRDPLLVLVHGMLLLCRRFLRLRTPVPRPAPAETTEASP